MKKLVMILMVMVILCMPTFAAASYDLDLLKNGNGESMEGWTDPNRDLWAADNEVTPHQGEYFLWPADTRGTAIDKESYIYQDIDLDAYKAGDTLILNGWLANYNQSPNDRATLKLSVLDNAQNSIVEDYRMQRDPEWQQHTIFMKVPQNAKTARVTLIATRFVGNDNDAYFDDISLTVSQKNYQIVTVTGDSETAQAGDTIQCIADNSVSENPTDYIWSTSYTEVASVDQNGSVTMLLDDEVGIYAKDKATGVTGVYWINSDKQNTIKDQDQSGDWQVSYITNDILGGRTTVYTDYLNNGELTVPPTQNPKFEGRVFKYWADWDDVDLDAYKAGNLPPAFDFNTPIVSDKSLFAVFEGNARKYLVTFDTSGGNPVLMTPQEVPAGQTATKPEVIPQSEAGDFLYWGAISVGGESLYPYDFSTPVNAKLALYAVYSHDPDAQYFTVRFDTLGGAPEPQTLKILSGGVVEKPAVDPVKEGYVFSHWATAEGKYRFENIVDRNMIIYAKYTKKGESHDNSHRKDIIIDDKDYDKAIITYLDPFFNGYPDGTFKPEDTITRAELATVFAKLLKLDQQATNKHSPFADLDGHWAKDNIVKIANYGIINGYPDGTFRPDAPMKRAEIATIINNYWHTTGFVPNNQPAPITDINRHWAKEMITALYNHRFTDLYVDNSFKPDAPLKRSDVAQILNRITDRPLLGVSEQKFSDVSWSHWAFLEIATAGSKVKVNR